MLALTAMSIVGALAAGSARADGSDLAVAFQIDVAHRGVQSDAALAPPFERRWQVTLPAHVSYPLIAEGKVFVTSGDSNSGTPSLYAFDQASGQIVWSHALPVGWPWANAAYDAGRIFVVGNSPTCCTVGGVMLAYAADTGDLVWSSRLPGQYMFSSPPTAANGVVYTGGAGLGGTLYAVRESDGALLATQPVANGDNSAPTLSGDSVFVSYACNQAYGFAQLTLRPLWHYSPSCEGGGGKTTVYADGRLYTRDSWGGDLILDAGTGALLRNYGPTNGGGYAPAVDSTAIYTTFAGWILTAQSLSGTPLWSFAGDGLLNTAPLVLNSGSGRLVIVGSWSGRLYALDAASGREVWSTDVGAPISGPFESGVSEVQAGLGIGQGLILVPSGATLSAYGTDFTAPSLTVPAPFSTTATSKAGAVVTYSASASDPDGTATVACTPPSGNTFPIGVTTVHCTANDAAGNSSAANFVVTVAPDTTSPTLTVPGHVTAAATSTAGATVTYSVSATDPDDMTTVSCAPPSGNTFPVGTTTVSCTATDGSGNGTNASFLVVVSAATADCNLSDYPLIKGALTLKNANLSGCYLPGANLSSANATNANLTGTYLDGASFSSANLSQANLTRAVLTHANIAGVTWNQTTCPDGTNSNTDGGTCASHLG